MLVIPNRAIDLYAVRKKGAGNEITINYSGDPFAQSKLWFDKNQLFEE